MKKALMTIIVAFLCGCAIPLPGINIPSLGGGAQQIQATTTVRLAENNYRLIKTNVVGTDWGINLLGVIPIVSPDYSKAMAKLYEAGGITEGRPYAIANILQQHTSPFFVLFSLPKIKISADVIEFTTGGQ